MREPGIRIPRTREANPGPETPMRALGIAMRKPGIATPGQEISSPAPRFPIPSAERLRGEQAAPTVSPTPAFQAIQG